MGDELKDQVYVIPPAIPERFLNLLSAGVYTVWRSQLKSLSRITYFGPPLPIRGVSTLIQAFALLQKEVPNSELCILSRIENESLLVFEEKLKKLSERLGISEQVRVVSGYLKPSDLVKELYSSRVICLPFEMVVSEPRL